MPVRPSRAVDQTARTPFSFNMRNIDYLDADSNLFSATVVLTSGISELLLLRIGELLLLLPPVFLNFSYTLFSPAAPEVDEDGQPLLVDAGGRTHFSLASPPISGAPIEAQNTS